MEKKPACQLAGKDGNVFVIIGNVARCLTRAGLSGEAEIFKKRAFAAQSYDEVIQLCMEYVEVW